MKLMRLLSLLAILLGLQQFYSCTLKDDIDTSSGLKVEMSVDTLRFDTVFTTMGSTTRSFKIYNRNKSNIRIKEIKVSNSAGGKFNMNVDGIASNSIKDLFLEAGDSTYVFVEVTVNPDQDVSISPFVFQGTVDITVSDVSQSVLIEAFGQNANYLPPNKERGRFGYLSCNFSEVKFDDPKPYVIYGSLVVDSCTLTLPPGTKLYVFGGLVKAKDFNDQIFNDGLLVFQRYGRLNIQGTAENPVEIKSVRREEAFKKETGMYSGIRFGAQTGPHTISHAKIQNGIVGVFVDSLASVRIDHTEIAYTSSNAIVGYHVKEVVGSNVLCHNNGAGALLGVYGGKYQFDYSTFVTHQNYDNPAVKLANHIIRPSDKEIVYNPLNANFSNSIMYSSIPDALSLLDGERLDILSYQLNNCVIRHTKLSSERQEFEGRCTDCLLTASGDTLFYAPTRDSFQLDSRSIARYKAKPNPSVLDDITGYTRSSQSPDIGAYEYQN